jgi:hypothetical protein
VTGRLGRINRPASDEQARIQEGVGHLVELPTRFFHLVESREHELAPDAVVGFVEVRLADDSVRLADDSGMTDATSGKDTAKK